MKDRDVAIVGMACVFPDAPDLDSYWRNIVNGRDAVREIPADRWPGSRNTRLPADHFAHIGCARGGFIPTPHLFDPLRFKVMPNVVRHGDVDQFILLQILGDALDDAGIPAGHPSRATTDVIVGRGGYTSNKMMEIFLRADLIDRLTCFLEQRFPGIGSSDLDRLAEEMNASLPELDADSMATSIPNLVASRAANRLDLRGAAYNVDAACASSLIAVEQSVRRLREGLCDVALACGVNFTHVPSFWYLFSKILAVSPTGTIRPFDRRADGLLIGEGAGAVVLKRLESARRDGDHIYAVVKGAGSASDGAEAGILAPSSGGQVKSLEQAYRDAGVDRDTIDLLEAHGTGTAQGDLIELQSIKTFFGKPTTRHATRVMGSVKSMIGHTMPAAGIASLIKTALALNNKILPASLHCEEPHADLDDAPFYVNSRSRPWVHSPNGHPRRAGINAFGFGGINSHVILEEVTSTASGPTAVERAPCTGLLRPSELLVFTGATPDDVAARIRTTARFLTTDRAAFELEDVAYTLAREVDLDAPCKLALVVTEFANLAGRLDEIAGRIEAGEAVYGDVEGLFYGTDASRANGKVAALFPGLAFPGLIGHYPDHLMQFCSHFPRFRKAFDLVEERDGHPDDPLPTSFILQPPLHLPEEERNRLRQRFAVVAPLAGAPDPDRPIEPDERLLSVMGMLTSNCSGWQLLEPFDIPFEMVCGQSLGDISAICASGSVDFEQVAPRLWRFLSIDPRITGLGCLAFVGTTEERLAPHLEGLPEVSIALHLSPETLIVGGPDADIETLGRLLRDDSIILQKLPFPPIHTPRMTDTQREMMALEGEPVPLREPRLAVYSNIAAAPMPDDLDELRALIANNVSHPVRFWQTLRRMYEDGARIFIQVGTGTLAGNVKTILPEADVVSVALDVDYRDPVTQLQHLCGTLLVKGVPVNLLALFEARRPRELPLDSPRPQPESSATAIPLSLYRPPLPGKERPAQDDSIPALPFVGRIVEHEPGRRLVQVRRFDLEEDLYLADHAFITCKDLKPLRECFPVVPLTVTLEMLAETAACLAPGLGLIGFQDVRARKWIALDDVDHLDVRVEAVASPAPDEGVAVEIMAFVGDEKVASATVMFAPRYRLSLDLKFSELTGAHAFPMESSRLYTDNHFFHGPRFHCIESIEARGDQGIAGHLTVPRLNDFLRSTEQPRMLLDPVVLDGMGQMLGAIFFDRGVDILPVSVDRIEFYRPAPPAGTSVPVRVEVTGFDLDERRVTAIMEAQDGKGRTWFRISGWRDLLFRYSRELLQARRLTTRYTLAQAQELPGMPDNAVAVMLQRSLMRDATPDRLARIFLHRDEWPAFEALAGNPRQQREWLMGRIAVKDAARLWLGRDGSGEMLHPILIRVENDPAGRPVVTLPEGHGSLPPAVSISHTRQAATAVAADRPMGIDIEPADGAGRLDLEDFATPQEILQLEQVGGGRGDAAWMTRLWCGKEAAAKAMGTGLQGRPKSFVAVHVGPDGGIVINNGDPPQQVQVLTCQLNGLMLAVASLPAKTSPSGSD